MIQQLTDLPDTAVGFRATGKITKADYETVLIPAVDKLAKETNKINFLLILDTDISNYAPGAIADDLKVGLKHLTQWKKMAIVSDQDAVNKFTDMFGHLLPGETRSYTMAQTDEAKKWVSE